MNPTYSLRLLLVCFIAAASAQAQAPATTGDTSPPPARDDAEPSSAAAAPGRNREEGQSAGPAQLTVNLPEVDDPMLAPLEPPPQVLGDWRQALRLVRARSTSLRSAQLQVTQAAAQVRQATARYYPTLVATGSVNHPLLSTGTENAALGYQQTAVTTWRGTVSFRQPLLDLQAWHDADTAEIAVEAASSSAQDAERQVLAAVADTILAVVTGERLAEVSRVSLRSSLSTLDLTRRRARLGAASAVDVLRAEQEVSLNRQQVIAADENVHQSREALGMALGFAQPWGVTPQLKLDEIARDAAAVCSVVDVSQRADLEALRKQREVAERGVQSANYQLAPTLDLTSDYTYGHPTYPADAKPMQWSIGALLTIPLYDGGSRLSQRMSLRAQSGLVEQELLQRQREVLVEVSRAKRAVQVAERNYEVGVESRRLAQETSRLAQLSFVNGRGTSFELVEAARRFQQAQLDLAVQEFEVVRARLAALLAEANCDI